MCSVYITKRLSRVSRNQSTRAIEVHQKSIIRLSEFHKWSVFPAQSHSGNKRILRCCKNSQNTNSVKFGLLATLLVHSRKCAKLPIIFVSNTWKQTKNRLRKQTSNQAKKQNNDLIKQTWNQLQFMVHPLLSPLFAFNNQWRWTMSIDHSLFTIMFVSMLIFTRCLISGIARAVFCPWSVMNR